MKAVSDGLPHDEHWSYELKWDGMRIQASMLNPAGGRRSTTDDLPEVSQRLLLRSGSGRDVTVCFPDLWRIGDNVDLDAVIDGELVVFDGERPSFSRLQQRIHVTNPTAALCEAHPVVFLAFDLLRLDNRATTSLPYLDRRRILKEIIQTSDNFRVPPHTEGSGADLLTFARERGLEGIMAKRSGGSYASGRSHDWRKIKLRRRQEFVIGGWLEGAGAIAGSIGSLLVGTYDGSEFVFAGAVGSGLSDKERDFLAGCLRPIKPCPFHDTPRLTRTPHWVEPSEVIEVGYAEWEPGRHLRHPTYEGRRSDKMASEVIRDRVEPLE